MNIDHKKTKPRGRGFNGDQEMTSVDSSGTYPPARSIEGWCIVVRPIHAEATEDDVVDFFSDFGPVKSCAVNLDRRTGYAKGYALIEYAKKSEAQAAVSEGTGKTILGETLEVEFAFLDLPEKLPEVVKSTARDRSASPAR